MCSFVANIINFLNQKEKANTDNVKRNSQYLNTTTMTYEEAFAGVYHTEEVTQLQRTLSTPEYG